MRSVTPYFLGALAAGLVVVVVGLGSGGEEAAPPAGAAAPDAGSSARARGRSSNEWLSARSARRSALSGVVTDAAGTPAAGATVVIRGPIRHESRTTAGGRFAFERMPAGDYVIFAAQGLRASEPLGPIPLGAGEELRDLALVLDAGAALSGTVRSLVDGAPIPAARVSAGAASAQAGDRGDYRLVGLPFGTVEVTASAEGFLPRTSAVELVQGRERSGADIHLERAARVRGVVRAAGLPVGGVEVLAARYGFGARLSELTSLGYTDGEGRFDVSVPPGRVELVARGGGWAETRSGELALAAGEEKEVDLELSEGGALFGAVRDAEGAGVAGCQVQAFDSVHGRVVGSSLTGPDGGYWIAALPRAVYLAVAVCPSGRAEASGIALGDGDEVRVDLALGGGSLAGMVIDAAGEPVVGAVISVKLDGSAAPATPAARSGAGGEFTCSGLSGERFTVVASTARGEAGAERSGVAAGTTDLVLQLGSGELVGLVVGDRGEPVPDFTVYAEPEEIGQGRAASKRFLSPSGEFRLAIEPGRYGVKVGAPGYAAASVANVLVPAVGSSQRVKVTLTRGYEVSGKVVDEQGRPVPGAAVATNPSMLWAFGRAAAVPSGSYATTDAEGAFRLTGVPPGEHGYLIAHKEGYRQAGKRISIPRDATGTVLVLRPSDPQLEAEREFAGVGMSLSTRQGRVLVVEVFEAGPARAAGIRRGDEILQVDGMPVGSLPLDAVVHSIRGLVGTTVNLVVRRDGRDFLVSVPRMSIKL
ncbi:MAG: carboxypeptidase regulatory-like domain-containing protein [Myxococcales bacterium]|jgi:hypothetical protein